MPSSAEPHSYKEGSWNHHRDDTTIIFGVKEMPLLNSRRLSWGCKHYICCGGNNIISFQKTGSWHYIHYVSSEQNATTYFQRTAITCGVEQKPFQKLKLNNISSGLILSLFCSMCWKSCATCTTESHLHHSSKQATTPLQMAEGRSTV
jgi:hypothetical protein